MVGAQILEISTFFSPRPLSPLGVSLFFIVLVLSLSLSFFLLALVFLCSPSLHLVVGGVRCQETREIDLEPRVKAHLKARVYFLSCTQRARGESVEMGRRRTRRGRGEIEIW